MSKVIKAGNSKGVYIPKRVLKEAHLNVGDEVSFDVNEKGQIIMEKDVLGEESEDVENAEKMLTDDSVDQKQYCDSILQDIKDNIKVDDESPRRVKELLKASKKGSVPDATKALTDKSLKDFL